jgi:hypothetical protein
MDEQTPDARPTFRDVRLRHDISLETIFAFVEGDIRWDTLQQFDQTGRADPYTVDDLLFVLSELSGHCYTRHDVDVTFVLARPPASPLHPEPLPGLPDHPTLYDLYVGYRLDLDWLAEALQTSQEIVWKCIIQPFDATHQRAVDLLRMISAYTNRAYTSKLMQEGRVIFSTLPYHKE